MKKSFIIKACLSVCLLLILIGALFAVILISTNGIVFAESAETEINVLLSDGLTPFY